MKACILNTTLRFSIGDGSESEIKVTVEYGYMPGDSPDDPEDDSAQVDIKRIKFRYEDHNGRLYWVELPDWMMEYIVANEVFRNQLIGEAEEPE